MDFGDAPPTLDADESSSVSKDTAEHSPSETDAEVLEGTELSETDTENADEPAEEVTVSPFGFGPYPEVPADYPDPDIWDQAERLYELSPESARNWELRVRVLIALWKQGKRTEGATTENGLVYPLYPNTVYIRWGEYIDENNTPVAYIEGVLGGASIERYEDDFDNDIIPPGITVIPYDEGGIEPYSFLNLR